MNTSVKSILKDVGFHILAKSGIPRLFHNTLDRNKLTILMYHAVVESPLEVADWCFLDSESFRKQIEYVKKHFDVLPLSLAAERCKSGKIMHPTAVLTFDDGFQNNYDTAFPILREESLPATIFLTTSIVDTDDTMWFCRLNKAIADSNKLSLIWSGNRFGLNGALQKKETSVALQSQLKELTHSLLLIELRKIILELGGDPDLLIPVNSPYRMLSHEAISDMSRSGLIEFGAHTHNHTILSLLTPQDRREEIHRSIEAVRSLTERPCLLFAYPNGRPQDYNSETITILKECGIRYAVTTIADPNESKTQEMELRRYKVGADTSMAVFQLRVHHFISQIKGMIS